MEGKPAVERKTTKTRRETAVQGTNDNSIVSKCSTVSSGYYEDPFLHFFVSKFSRRAPLIHRGYYIRATAFDRVLKNFLSRYEGKKNQIISLGCGFDSSYFRLKSEGMLKDTTFCEVDFPDLVRRKRLLIENTGDLSALIVKNQEKPKSPHIELSCIDYHLLGIDLTQLNTLEAALRMCGLDLDAPTLLFSECVMTYMTRRCSTDLVRWAAETFEEAIFAMYEQINPDDAFGLFMQNHFHSIGSPLKCINAFPTLESQYKRYHNNGWAWVEAVDMNQMYYQCLPPEERTRVERMESFDEYEELNLKYSHYFILTASTHSATDSLLSGQGLIKLSSLPPATPDILTISRPVSPIQPVSQAAGSVHRFGHSTSRACGHLAVTTGGFGETDGRHQRLAEVTITDLSTHTSYHVTCSSPHIQYSRMHHASVTLSDGTVYLIGGRQSPYYLCEQMIRLRFVLNDDTTTQTQSQPPYDHHSLSSKSMDTSETLSGCRNAAENDPSCHTDSSHCQRTSSSVKGVPQTTHCADRNSSTSRNVQCSVREGQGNVLGPELPYEELREVWPFSLGEMEARVVQQKGCLSPSQRWRHAAVVVTIEGREHILVFGGKTKDGSVLDDCYLFDPSTDIWTKIACSGTAPGPVHSHSMVSIPGHVVVTGGMDQHQLPQASVHVLALDSWTWTRLDLRGLLYPRYSHTSHYLDGRLVLVGGVNQHFPPPGVAVVSLQDKKVHEFALPAQDKKQLLMFHRHTSLPSAGDTVTVFGGGGNCFSFGTHLNHTPVTLNVSACLSSMEQMLQQAQS